MPWLDSFYSMNGVRLERAPTQVLCFVYVGGSGAKPRRSHQGDDALTCRPSRYNFLSDHSPSDAP